MKFAVPKINLAKHTRALERLITDNSPTILTGIGVIGVAATAYLTYDAAFKASDVLHDEAGRRNIHREATEPLIGIDDFTKAEKFHLTWKLYIAPFISGTMSCAAIIAANRISAKRAAALAGLLALTQDDLKDYRDKVAEHVTGPKKQKIDDEVAQEKAERSLEQSQLDAMDPSDGDIIMFESYTGRPFMSNRNKVEKAVNEINRRILRHESASLSDFYDVLNNPDLIHTDISDEVGWNTSCPMEVDYTPIFAQRRGQKVAVTAVTYAEPPIHRPHAAGSFRDDR